MVDVHSFWMLYCGKERGVSGMEIMVFLFIFIFQAGTISLFYTLFFAREKKWSFFLKTIFFMMGVVYPAGLLVPQSMMIARNVLNCVLEIVFLKRISRNETWKRVMFGVLLCQLALVISEVLGGVLFYLVFERSPRLAEFSRLHMSDMFLMYVFGSCLLLIILCGMIVLFSKAMLLNEKMSGYLLSLLLNVILVALCACQMIEPINVLFFSQTYWLVLAFLGIINICTFVSLFRFVRKEKEKLSRDILEAEYAKQLMEYIRNEKSEQALRQFRHDLLNYMESRDKEIRINE